MKNIDIYSISAVVFDCYYDCEIGIQIRKMFKLKGRKKMKGKKQYKNYASSEN